MPRKIFKKCKGSFFSRVPDENQSYASDERKHKFPFFSLFFQEKNTSYFLKSLRRSTSRNIQIYFLQQVSSYSYFTVLLSRSYM